MRFYSTNKMGASCWVVGSDVELVVLSHELMALSIEITLYSIDSKAPSIEIPPHSIDCTRRSIDFPHMYRAKCMLCRAISRHPRAKFGQPRATLCQSRAKSVGRRAILRHPRAKSSDSRAILRGCHRAKSRNSQSSPCLME